MEFFSSFAEHAPDFGVFVFILVASLCIIALPVYFAYKGFCREQLMLEQELTKKVTESFKRLEIDLNEKSKRFSDDLIVKNNLFVDECIEKYTLLENTLSESESKIAELTALKVRQIEAINKLKQELKLAS